MIRSAAVDLFEEVKAQTNIVDILKFYGINVNNRNKAICCFHNEKTPSLVLYPNTNSFYCFGCGIGGSGIDFVSRYFSLEPLEAAKKLAIDFNLGLCDIGLSEEQKKEYTSKQAEREQNKRLAEEFKQWESEYYDYVVSNLKLLEQLKEISSPLHCDYKFTDDYAYAINRGQLLEYHWCILFYGSLEERINLYAQVRKTVSN